MKQPPAWYDSNADNPLWIKALAGWAYVRGLVFGCPTALPHGERLLQTQELRRLIWRLTNEPTIAYYLVRRLRFIPWRYSWRMGVAPFRRPFQRADLSARKLLDELLVIQPASGRLSSSSRKTNDSYGRPVACRRPISQVRFAEM
jgi:hypothetical protein